MSSVHAVEREHTSNGNHSSPSMEEFPDAINSLDIARTASHGTVAWTTSCAMSGMAAEAVSSVHQYERPASMPVASTLRRNTMAVLTIFTNLLQGAIVLVAGPIGAVYGHKNMLIYRTLWLGVCNLVCGFCNNFITFVIMRALSGIGGALIMPNAVAILTITNPPGLTYLEVLAFFSASQAPSSGWSSPAVVVCLIVSIALLALFLAWEQYATPHPIMPLSIFKAPSFGILILVALFNFMAVGIFCWYQTLWLQEIWHWSLLHFALSWTPFVICAIAAASLSAWQVPRLDAQWILAIGTLTILGACLLMATLSEPRIYWPQVFPSVVLFAFSPDLVYTAAQIIASNSVSRQHQGTAGSLISILNLYGVSLGLGFAGTIEVQTNDHGRDKVLGFRAALYFGVAMAAVAVLVDVFFIRCVKDEKRGWDEGDLSALADQELEARAMTSGASPPTVTVSSRV
ncbi:hypothetical protein A1O3_01712 [Capronia epimyces CBS 606.96]|uniref:Major facilitator superfamily (MFS) profile domain-containing protein n=1 Tax=Capronia epimyces CBS 606.96 TaxID=1182542 RepID=W9YTY8_9EURO|nr:uncharacterized protein A1O3_01712 [Capronia epimyces CBS 606.96]EXJ93155.1 hypothetical protein A1O3_01712 [Capronia epimyces CBS 606.96]